LTALKQHTAIGFSFLTLTAANQLKRLGSRQEVPEDHEGSTAQARSCAKYESRFRDGNLTTMRAIRSDGCFLLRRSTRQSRFGKTVIG